MESSCSNRQQRTKINNAFSRYSEVIYGVPQGSILGVLTFNIYICGIFFDIIECDIASYANDNTSYNFNFSLDNVIGNLEKSTNSLLNWFRENHIKANADKYHLLVSSDESCTAKIEYFSIKNSTEEKQITRSRTPSHSSVTVHQKKLQVLLIEIYKVINGIAPDIVKDIFELQNPSYNHSHKKRIVWKHGPNWPFHALMLRTKLY